MIIQPILLSLLGALCWAAPVDISSPTLSLGLDDFVELALFHGISGRQTTLNYDTARYSNDVALRRTYGPSLTANLSGSHSLSETTNVLTRADSGESNMTLNQPTPIGTNLAVTGRYTTSLTRTPGSSSASYLRPGWSATLTQPLFIFTGNSTLRTRKRARLTFDGAQETYRSGILGIKTKAKALYYDVLLKKESLEVEKRKFQAAKLLYDVSKELFKAGKVPEIESMRSRVRFERDRRKVLDAENDLKKAKQNANNYIYLSLDKPVEYTSRLSYEPFDLSLERLRDYALAYRPELKRLRREVDLSNISVDESKEPNLPAVNLNASYSSDETDTRANEVFSTSLRHEWRAGASMSWRFFDSFINRDEVRQARIARELAELAYIDARRSTVLEIKNAYLDVKNAESQLLDYIPVLKAAKNNIDILRIKFKHGRGTLIDVFDAETESRGVAIDYLNLIVNYLKSQDTLAEFLGTDLELLR